MLLRRQQAGRRQQIYSQPPQPTVESLIFVRKYPTGRTSLQNFPNIGGCIVMIPYPRAGGLYGRLGPQSHVVLALLRILEATAHERTWLTATHATIPLC